MNDLLPIADLSAELSWIIFAADVTLKVTLVFAAAALITFCLRRKSAALRHRIWSLAVAAGLVIPLLAAVVPQWQVPILPAWLAVYFSPPAVSIAEEVLVEPPPPIVPFDELRTIVEQPQRELPPPRPIDFPPDRELEPVTLPAFVAEPVVIADDATEETSVRDPLPSSPSPRTILVVWLAGFALCFLRLCAGSLFNALLLSKSRIVTDRQWTELIDDARRLLGLRRRVRSFVVDRNVIPMTWGIWRPLILLPGSSSEWSESRRRIVLLHELAHVARFDPPLQLMTRLVTALYWFHPLVWLAAYRLQVEREFACDDCVVNAGQRATDYASELVSIAETHRMPRLTSALTMARTSRLEARLRSMFDRARSHQPLHRSVAVALVVISGLVASSLAMMQPVSRGEVKPEQEPEPQPNASTEITAPVEKFEKAEANTITHAIHGQCLEDDEKTVVAGAEVKAYHFPPDEPPALVAETVADDDGRFAIDDIGQKIARQPGRVTILLISTHEKHVTNIYWLTLRFDQSDEKPLQVFMSKDIGRFFGTVRDTGGKPVAGARVVVRSKYGSSIGERFVKHFDTNVHNAVTDENGRYAIDNLRRNMVYTTVVTFPVTENIDANVTYPPTSTIVEEQGIPRELDISLPPPGFIEGRVLDAETEMPIGDVVVKANGNSRLLYQESRSDSEGRFRLSLGADTYTVWAESDDRLALKREPVVLEQGETESNIDIRMVKPVTVTGTIRDANGEPHNFGDLALGYSVHVSGPTHLWIVKPLNADGTYSIGVAPGKNLFDVGGRASVYTTVPAQEPFYLDIVWGNVEGQKTYHRDLGAERNAMIARSRDAERKRKASLNIAQATASVKAGNDPQKARDAVKRAIAYLLAQQNDDGTWTAKENFTVGCTALCTLALLEAGAAKDHDQIVKALDYLAAQKPDKTYEVATQTLAFCAADPEKYRAEIQRNVDWLQDAQLDTGTWNYGSPKTGDGDASNAEFAIWALDEAAYAGFEIRKDTWKKTRKYFIESQLPGGSWSYMPQAKAGTGSMTCAGIASLCICLDHLDDENEPEYEQAAKAIEHGFLWLSEHYTVKQNPGSPNWHLYYLMLLRRVGELTGVLSLADPHSGWDSDVNAFFANAEHRKDGSWSENGGNAGDHMATAFVLLTLKDNHARDSIYKHKRVRGKVGRVVDEQGQPLKNGPVMISWVMAGLQQPHTVVARTNDNGEFEFYYPPKFVPYQWRLALDSSPRGGSKPEVIQEDPLVLRVPRVRNSLLGIWKIVPNENKDLPQTYQPGTEVFIASDTISYWFDLNTDVKMHEEEYLVNAFHTPAHIDIVTKDNVHLGVFEVNHDRLSLCIERNESERPAEVMPKTNADQYSILTLQRIDVRKTVAPFFDFKKITPVEEKIFATLQASGEIDFNQIPIKDALTFLGEQYGVQVVYDEVGANKAGIDPNVTVTLTLTHVSFHEELEMILRPLKLKYIVEDGVIKVTAAE